LPNFSNYIFNNELSAEKVEKWWIITYSSTAKPPGFASKTSVIKMIGCKFSFPSPANLKFNRTFVY